MTAITTSRLDPLPAGLGRNGSDASIDLLVDRRIWYLLAFAGLHIPLVLVALEAPVVATLHALATIGVTLVLVLQRQYPERAIYAVGYIVGCELVWRGARSAFLWEGAKYAVILTLLTMCVQYGLRPRKARRFILFILLLIPSLFVLPYFDREDLASNLSGPVLVGVAAFFFSAVRLRRLETVTLFLFVVAPVVGLAAAGAVSTLTANPAAFEIGGKATTAGIGPNQVSAMLGLGMVLTFLLQFVTPVRSVILRRVLLALVVWLGIQCLVTFSRGGLWGSLGSMAVAGWFVIRERRARRVMIASMIVAAPLIPFVLLPEADSLTRGLASERFTQTDMTGRDLIMKADLIAFREHPILGVGPGQSYFYHHLTFRASQAHTEYTRLLAEHGSLGVLALLILLWTALGRLRQGGSPLAKACTLSLTAWTLMYLVHSATRLAASGFAFGLGGALFILDQEQAPSPVVGSSADVDPAG